MDATLKSKWIAALRSGEFTQAQGSLKDGDSYCCLGVLCVLKDIKFDDADYVAIAEWDGSYAQLLPELPQSLIEQLWPRNDGASGYEHHSFEQIADFIEKNVSVDCPLPRDRSPE